jgi:hypothetical protein
MGYRSQVGYAIEFSKQHYQGSPDGYTEEMKVKDAYSKQLFYTFLAESKVKRETMKAWDDEVKDGLYVKTGIAPTSYGCELTVDEENQHIIFRAQDVKWYDSYEDVDAHNAMITLAEDYISGNEEERNLGEENEEYMSYTFVRIGEESDDVECKSGGNGETDNYLYPVSSIQWDI